MIYHSTDNYWKAWFITKQSETLIQYSVKQSLVLCVCFVDRCLSFCTDSDCPCVSSNSFYRYSPVKSANKSKNIIHRTM